MRTQSLYVHERDVMKGDTLDGKVVSGVSYSGKYIFSFTDGTTEEWGNRLMDEIFRPVPDEWLDWSDTTFKDVPIIHARPTDSDDWTSEILDTGKSQSDGMHTYYPALVKGYYSEYLFENWTGVGPSNHPYTMKCMIRDDGKICRPDNDKVGYRSIFAPAMVHNSSWVLPYLSALRNSQSDNRRLAMTTNTFAEDKIRTGLDDGKKFTRFMLQFAVTIVILTAIIIVVCH